MAANSINENPVAGQGNGERNDIEKHDNNDKNIIERAADNQAINTTFASNDTEMGALLEDILSQSDMAEAAIAADFTRDYSRVVLTADYVSDALMAIDPNTLTRDEWVSITYSVRAIEADHGLDLFHDWEDWSRQYSNGDERADIAVWKSCANPTRIGAGTLFLHAKDAGWRSDDRAQPLRERSAAEMKARAARRKELERETAALIEKKRASCNIVWEKAQEYPGIAKRYFEGRGIPMIPDNVFRVSTQYVNKDGDIRTANSAGRFNILSRIRSFETGEPVGLHVNGVTTSTKNYSIPDWRITNATMPDGAKARFTCGGNVGYIELVSTDSRALIVAEGVETALSALNLPLGFDNPNIRALVNDGNFRKMPVVYDIDTLVILVDIEESGAGRRAADALASTWLAAGKEVRIVEAVCTSKTTKRDLNDVVQDCAREGREAEEGRDYTNSLRVPAPKIAPAEIDIDGDNWWRGLSLDEAIDSINKEHSFVMEGGRATVFREAVDAVTKKKYYVRYALADFRAKFGNIVFQPPSNRKNAAPAVLGETWLKSPKRLQFLNGVVFDPANRYGSSYKNLWQGFAYEPIPGDWGLLKDHLLNIICGRKQEVFEYVMDWCAKTVQFPAKQGEVAIVMRGPEGAGKGLFAKAFKTLFGAHGQQITDAGHLVGRFNGHLQGCVFLFADEAFFAGDKAHRNILYALISEPTLFVEAKFRDAAEVINYLHIMMATNYEWAVPSSINDRRFLVLDVLGIMMGNLPYFAEIAKQLESGGYEAMLHELLHRDISRFNPNKIPNTSAMDDQKILSLPTHQKWWQEVLERGYVWQSQRGLEEEFEQWYDEMSTDLLYASYRQFAAASRERYPLARNKLGEFLWKIATAKAFGTKHTVLLGEKYCKMDNAWQPRLNVTKKNGYVLGSLDEARKAFCKFLNIEINWEPAQLAEDSDSSGDADKNNEAAPSTPKYIRSDIPDDIPF
jgi:hypothetical protein